MKTKKEKCSFCKKTIKGNIAFYHTIICCPTCYKIVKENKGEYIKPNPLFIEE